MLWAVSAVPLASLDSALQLGAAAPAPQNGVSCTA